jgi:hypothetical protein
LGSPRLIFYQQTSKVPAETVWHLSGGKPTFLT